MTVFPAPEHQAQPLPKWLRDLGAALAIIVFLIVLFALMEGLS